MFRVITQNCDNYTVSKSEVTTSILQVGTKWDQSCLLVEGISIFIFHARGVRSLWICPCYLCSLLSPADSSLHNLPTCHQLGTLCCLRKQRTSHRQVPRRSCRLQQLTSKFWLLSPSHEGVFPNIEISLLSWYKLCLLFVTLLLRAARN